LLSLRAYCSFTLAGSPEVILANVSPDFNLLLSFNMVLLSTILSKLTSISFFVFILENLLLFFSDIVIVPPVDYTSVLLRKYCNP
jgi:hypothetical protein